MINFVNKIPVSQDKFSDVEEVFKVTAFCFEDNTNTVYHGLFTKEATIEIRGPADWVIHLGGPISYRVQDLERHGYPKDEWLFCIDAGGRNHGVDKPVYVHVRVIQALMDIARRKALEDAMAIYGAVSAVADPKSACSAEAAGPLASPPDPVP